MITICARGGSKGIPGKNIRMLAGKPLLAYSISTATAFAKKIGADIALSTDDRQIASAAEQYGLITDYTRPAALAGDDAEKKETIRDLVLHQEKKSGSRYAYILDLDVTSPLRSVADLEKAFVQLVNDPDAINLFSVNPASRNPYFNMVEKNEEGYYSLVKKGNFVTRQSAPAVYDLNASFYWYRRMYFDEPGVSVINNRSLIYIMDHICFDLDHEEDFQYMEYLLLQQKIDFIA